MSDAAAHATITLAQTKRLFESAPAPAPGGSGGGAASGGHGHELEACRVLSCAGSGLTREATPALPRASR